jgi:signal transduction histidine kinase
VREDLIGKTMMELIPAEDVARLDASKQALLVPGTVDTSAWRLRHKHGHYVPVEVSARILPDGRWQAFARDIRERLRAEADRERLLQIERRQRQRLEALRLSALAITALDAGADAKAPIVLQSIVDQARQLTGADYAALGIGVDPAKPFDPWVWSGVSAEQVAAIGETPRPRGILGAVALQDKALRLARLYDQLQAAGRMREELMAVVSHDLKNPLNSIALREQLLERSPDPTLKQHAAIVRRAVSAMQRMIRGILDMASLEAGELHLDLAEHDLAGVVGEVVDLVSPIAADREISLVCRMPELPPARIDRERLLQVVSNLVGNALKFTAGGGKVTIEAAPRGQELEVSVADTGVGIATDALPRVFDRYFTTARGGEGTGLGLHIAKQLVEAHGGRIWCESQPDKGTKFSFTVPRGAA